MIDKIRNAAFDRALRNVKNAFAESLIETKAELLANVPDNDKPRVRAEFNKFAEELSQHIKNYDLHTRDNKVTASLTTSPWAMIRVAVDTYKKGHTEEAAKLFAFAAVNTQDLYKIYPDQIVPHTSVVSNKCMECMSPLPSIANFCPICGKALQNHKQVDVNLPISTPVQLEPALNTVAPQMPPLQMPLPQFPNFPPIMLASIKKLIKAGMYVEANDLINKVTANKRVYVAMDGDNIGASVEKAAMSNDLKAIIENDKVINKGQALLRAWAKENEGVIYIDGGDDISMSIPEDKIEMLEDLRKAYASETGFTITVGVGDQISHAVTALMYGKLSGKDQMVQWSENIQSKYDEIKKDPNACEKLKGEELA